MQPLTGGSEHLYRGRGRYPGRKNCTSSILGHIYRLCGLGPLHFSDSSFLALYYEEKHVSSLKLTGPIYRIDYMSSVATIDPSSGETLSENDPTGDPLCLLPHRYLTQDAKGLRLFHFPLWAALLILCSRGPIQSSFQITNGETALPPVTPGLVRTIGLS